MSPTRALLAVLLLFSGLLTAQLAAADHHGEVQLTMEQILTGDHRSTANIARNESRHPVETLEFFGLTPDMTLIEIGPSGGWYAEVLAPYMRDQGRYFGAHFSPNSPTPFHRRSLESFEEKIRQRPDIWERQQSAIYFHHWKQ